jgi:hypothetical protein
VYYTKDLKRVWFDCLISYNLLPQHLISTADHPQTDGQSEIAVKVIQKLFRPFIYQDQDWEELLPTLEFAYNDTKQSTTRETPFYLNYGFHPTGTTRHEVVTNPHVEDHI